MGVIEILTILLVIMKLWGVTTVSWFWILLPETLITIIYFVFLFSELKIAGRDK
jgi:hypothetical protein